MLALADVHTYYGSIRALRGISLTVEPREIVTLIGANGAGKTTTLRTILGAVRPSRGTVTFNGQRVDGLATDRIVRLGIAQSPEGRRIFPRMTVLEKLEMGAFARTDRDAIGPQLECGFTPVPARARARRPEGRAAARRGAADAGHRARAHGAAEPAPARRAVDGPLPHPRRRHLQDRPGHQSPGHHHPARGAERPHGPARRASGIRHPDRTHRAPGRGLRAAPLGPRPEDLPRREIAGRETGGSDDRHGAPIDCVFAPVNRGGPVGNEEGHQFSDLFGPAGPANRNPSKSGDQAAAGSTLVSPGLFCAPNDEAMCGRRL